MTGYSGALMATPDDDWYNNLVLIFSIIGWWYSKGWQWVFASAVNRLNTVQHSFSVGTLFRTLFSPWKQIVGASAKDQSLDNKFRSMLDSLISRFVGFMVRTLTLLAAFFSLSLVLVLGLFSVIVWPFIPAVIVITVLLFAGVL